MDVKTIKKVRNPDDVLRAKKFGEIVQALILEIADEYGSEKLARERIAENAGLSKGLIDNIIDAERLHLRPRELLRLSKALNLTSRERLQLFLLAAGITGKDESRKEVDDNKVLESQIDILKEIRLPCILLDNYANIIAANGAIALLYGISYEVIQSERKRLALYKEQISASTENLLSRENVETNPLIIDSAFNLLRIIFDSNLGFRSAVKGNWERIARHNIQYFRELTLRLRNEKKFKRIFSELKNEKIFPGFFELWQEAWKYEEDHYSTSLFYHYSDPFSKDKFLSFYTASTITITGRGELSLTVYLPATEYTANVFSKIVRERDEVLRFASWPD